MADIFKNVELDTCINILSKQGMFDIFVYMYFVRKDPEMYLS